MKIRALCFGFLGLVEGFQTLQSSSIRRQSPYDLHRLHGDVSSAPFRPKKWLEKFSRNRRNDLTSTDSNDDGENGEAAPMMTNEEYSSDIDDLDQRGTEAAEVNTDQASLGAAALAAGLTVALDVGFLDVATKLELAATLGLMANFFTTKPTGTAGELLQSAGVFVTSSAAAASDLFQNISATVTSKSFAETGSLKAVSSAAAAAAAAAAELPTTGEAAQEEESAGGSAPPEGQALSAIGVREGFAASESATRRLMRPDVSNGNDSPGDDAPDLVETQELQSADNADTQPDEAESRSAAIRQRLGRVAQNKVFRFALAASIAVIIFTTTGKA